MLKKDKVLIFGLLFMLISCGKRAEISISTVSAVSNYPLTESDWFSGIPRLDFVIEVRNTGKGVKELSFGEVPGLVTEPPCMSNPIDLDHTSAKRTFTLKANESFKIALKTDNAIMSKMMEECKPMNRGEFLHEIALNEKVLVDIYVDTKLMKGVEARHLQDFEFTSPAEPVEE